jgi:hypothetical protein
MQSYILFPVRVEVIFGTQFKLISRFKRYRHYLNQFLVLSASFLIFLTFYLNFRPRHPLPLCEAEVFQIQIQARWKRHKVLAISSTQ